MGTATTKAPAKNEAKAKEAAKAKKSTVSAEDLPDVKTIVRECEKSRAAFNAYGAGWTPDKKDTEGIKVRGALRIARKRLTKKTGANDFKAACVKADYNPEYRARGSKS